MKSYGAKKATEFTRKQINVLFAKAKNGELNIEKWVINDMYNLADFYGYDDNKSVEFDERFILTIIEDMFAGNIEETQKGIDNYTECKFSSLSQKRANSIDRALV